MIPNRFSDLRDGLIVRLPSDTGRWRIVAQETGDGDEAPGGDHQDGHNVSTGTDDARPHQAITVRGNIEGNDRDQADHCSDVNDGQTSETPESDLACPSKVADRKSTRLN